MPLYDFRCRACGRQFEALVRPHDQAAPRCPSCDGGDLEQLLSSFAVSSAEKTQAAATKKRRKEAAAARRENVAIEAEAAKHRAEEH